MSHIWRNKLSIVLAEVTGKTPSHILMKHCHNAAMVIENLEAEIESLKEKLKDMERKHGGITSNPGEEVQAQSEGLDGEEEAKRKLDILTKTYGGPSFAGQETVFTSPEDWYTRLADRISCGDEEPEDENRPLYHRLRTDPEEPTT